MKFSKLYLIIAIVLAGSACAKQSETFDTATLASYFPLQVGKTFLYRLDLTVPASFGSSLLVKSYLAKDTVESTFFDGQGRLSYRIYRLLTDTLQKKPFSFAATYVATPTQNAVEYVDNNMRFIKLHGPVVNGFRWKAHSFIDTKSINTTVSYLDEWEYEYQDVSAAFKVFNRDYDSTATIFQQNETSPDEPFSPNLPYQQHNFAKEVYAKNVGLIYKEFLHYTWQSNPPPSKYEDGSYGIRLRLISHN